MDQQPIDTTSSDQQQALADQNSVQPKNVFSYTSDNMIKEGDTVIIWESADSIKQIQMKRGSTFQNKHGAFPHGDIIDKVEYGTKVFSKSMMGWMHILRPNSHIYTTSLAQRTQILYTPDISQVLFKLELQPGYRVAESGTGSGSLSVSILKTIVPTGHLFTYEFNQVRAEKAKEDFQRLGFYPNNVHVTHRDVLNNGFLLNDDQTQEVLVAPGSIDAIFLDLPSPERAVPHAYQVLRKGGKLCNFSPCIEQVQKAVTEMARQGFYEIRTYETLTREYTVNKYEYESLNKVKKDVQEEEDQSKQQLNKRTQKQKDKNMIVTAPRIDQRGHTGFLTFAIKF
eukprot:403351184